MARECPSKGKGKQGANLSQPGYGKAKGKGWQDSGAKGKGKDQFKGGGKGKGKRAPMYGGCWNCGEAHFAADCPRAKGKGGKGGLYAVEEEHYYEDATQNIRALCSMIQVTDDPKQDHEWKLVNFLKKKPRQGQIKRDKKNAEEQRRSTGSALSIVGGDRRGLESTGRVQQLGIFQTIEPEGFNSVGSRQEWESIELAVDSGASETVIGEDMLTAVETKEGPASRRGVQYEVANGVRIPNLGEKHFSGYTHEGFRRSMKAQVCDVNKALLSVHKLVQAGNKVVFEREGSYVEDEVTGEKMWLQEKGGMYMLKMWVRNEDF